MTDENDDDCSTSSRSWPTSPRATRKQHRLRDVSDRRVLDALIRDRPHVAGILWQAEAEAEAVITGWRVENPDHCRRH
jgi:hypothetical protein